MTISDFLKTSQLSGSDARQILEKALNTNQTFILSHPETVLSDMQAQTVLSMAHRRKQGIALAYVTENRAFYKNDFYVNENVLIPQPDTEILVEQAVKIALKMQDKDRINILDLCTGSGCIGISVAKELAKSFKNVNLTLSDISLPAYSVFSQNAKNLLTETNIHLTLNLGNLFEGITGKFNLILTNPPYIERSLIPTLPLEVQQEPIIALDGGKDGLEIINKIISQSRDFLLDNSFILIEISYNQSTAVEQTLKNNNFQQIQIIHDLSNLPRVAQAISNAV